MSGFDNIGFPPSYNAETGNNSGTGGGKGSGLKEYLVHSYINI